MHTPKCQPIDKAPVSGDSLEELLNAPVGGPWELIPEKYWIPIATGVLCFALGGVLGAWGNRSTMEYYAVRDGVAHYRLNERTGKIEFTWLSTKGQK